MFVHEPIETNREAKQRETDKLIEGKLGSSNIITNFIAYITGTIGGAGLELQVISRLRDLLEKQNPFAEVISFGLNKGAKGYEVIPLDSLCGGKSDPLSGSDDTDATCVDDGRRALC